MGCCKSKYTYVEYHVSNLNNCDKKIKIEIYILENKIKTYTFPENCLMENIKIPIDTTLLIFYYKKDHEWIKFNEEESPYEFDQILELRKIEIDELRL